MQLKIIIHFPWDEAVQKFAGERIYFDRLALAGPGAPTGALPETIGGTDHAY